MDVLGRRLCSLSHCRPKLRWAGITPGIAWCLVGQCPQGHPRPWALTSQPWRATEVWEEEPESSVTHVLHDMALAHQGRCCQLEESKSKVWRFCKVYNV